MIKEISDFEDLLEFVKKEKNWFLLLAIIYIRVSTQEQAEEGYSLDAQRKYLMAYAQKIGMKYIFVVVETETARKSGRSQFKKLLEFYQKRTKAGSCPALIVEKVDRLSRNPFDKAAIDHLIRENSLHVHYAKENKVLSDQSRSSEFFLNDIQHATASFYVNQLAEEAKKGMSEKAAQGMYPSCAPIGYINVTDTNGKKVLAPDPKRAPLIKKIFQWYDSGNHSLAEIAGLAKEQGLTHPRSERYVPKSSIFEILNRLTYAGSFQWNGKEYPGTYEAIITRELFDRVQESLHGNAQGSRKATHSFAFKGLFKCGYCGCAITVDPPKKEKKYIYYHCTGNHGECPNKRHSVREEVIEAQVIRSLQAMHLDDDVLDWIIASLREQNAATNRIHQEAITRLDSQMQRLELRKKNLITMRLDEEIEAADYNSRREEIQAEMTGIEKQIEAHRQASPENLENGIKLLELMQGAEMLYKNQPAQEKRKLLQFVYSNSTLHNGQVQFNFRKPFDLLVVTNAEYQKKKAASGDGSDLRPIWLPGPDSNQRQGG